jgi:hypothetical protein
MTTPTFPSTRWVPLSCFRTVRTPGREMIHVNVAVGYGEVASRQRRLTPPVQNELVDAQRESPRIGCGKVPGWIYVVDVPPRQLSLNAWSPRERAPGFLGQSG